MADYTIQLTGTDELINNLKKIDGSIRNDVAAKAVTAGAIQIGNKAWQNAPVKTGALRNSAGINPDVNGSLTKVITRSQGDEVTAEIGFRGLSYARIQEFGGLAGRNHSVNIKGKHYLQRAIDETQTLVVDAMSDVVKAYLGSI